MNDQSWNSTHIDDIDRAGNRWIPVRKHFDIRAFGINAWQAKAEGDDVVGEHTEDSRHEELYVVTEGHASFTIDGTEVDAPAGTYVYVRPEASRKAVAREAGTTVLSIGATPGEAFEVRGWEVNAEMMPLYEAGDYAGAAALLDRALEKDPVGHLTQALADAPERYLEMARNDSDLASIRDDPRVAELLAPKS